MCIYVLCKNVRHLSILIFHGCHRRRPAAVEGYLVAGLMNGRVVAWEAKHAGNAPTEILALDAHAGAVTSLSFPKQVWFCLFLKFGRNF